MFKNVPWRYFDFWLLGAVVLATAFGTTMIRSAVAQNEVLMPLIDRQIYFALLGIVLIFVVGAIDYRYWMALYRPIFILMSILLFALFLSAQAVFGAARWFQLGVLFLQPTEFAKIAAILLLARYCSLLHDNLNKIIEHLNQILLSRKYWLLRDHLDVNVFTETNSITCPDSEGLVFDNA